MGMRVHPKFTSGELSVQVWTKNEKLGEATVQLKDVTAEQELSVPLEPRGEGVLNMILGAPEILSRGTMGKFESLGEAKPLQSIKVDDITGAGPLILGTAPLPPQLQGLFWLSDQGPSSALCSFGGPNDDGAGCNPGQLLGKKFELRVPGDRVWSFATKEVAQAVEKLNLQYLFEFNDDKNPTHASIHPQVSSSWTVELPEWAWNFTMDLADDPEFPESVVWHRHTTVGPFKVKKGTYKLIQVIDGKGKRIFPAWSKFVEYQKTSAGSPNPEGIIWYRAESSWAGKSSSTPGWS